MQSGSLDVTAVATTFYMTQVGSFLALQRIVPPPAPFETMALVGNMLMATGAGLFCAMLTARVAGLVR